MQAKLLQRLGADILLAGILFLITLLLYSQALFRIPLVYGIDGPYYLIQVDSILRTWGMRYPDPPFSFYFFSLLTLIFKDVTFSVKLGTALLCSTTVFPAYFLIKKMTNSRTASATGSLFASLSPGLISMSGEFLKNAIGIPFLLSFIYFSYRILTGDHGLESRVFFVLSFFLTGLTHILDTGVALLFLLTEVIIASLSRNRNPGFLRFSLLFLAGIFGLGTILYLSSKGYTIDIGKGIVFVEQFIKSLEFHPFFDVEDRIGVRSLSYLLVALGFVLTHTNNKKGHWENSVLLFASSITLLCLSFPMLPPQWAMRFNLVVFVPGFVIAGNALSLFERTAWQMVVSVVLLGFVFFFQSLPTFVRIGPRLNPLQYQDLSAMSRFIPSGSAVVSPRFEWRYWIEYLFDSRMVGGPLPYLLKTNREIYLISDSKTPPPTLRATLLYSGRTLGLYLVLA